MSGIMIAAVKSGSGKTTITCGLLEALKEYGVPISAFKCGPDYIDPMFHKRVIGIESRNLDTFFSDEGQIRELYMRDRQENEISVVEGVMGLYDGLGGIKEEGSAYHLASVLGIPIVLVVDAHGMARTLVAVLAGILQFDKEHLIRGIIINRTSKMFYQTLKPIIEEELGIEVLGYYPVMRELHLESRHLGLKLPHEITELQEQVQLVAEQLKNSVEIEKIYNLLNDKEKYEVSKQVSIYNEEIFKCEEIFKSKLILNTEKVKEKTSCKKTVRIAFAMDEAFCFYYKDNLRMLEDMGAELIPFSPIHDQKLPEGVQGLVLGGGYPELVAKELSENVSMRSSIRNAIEEGIPSLAECGGFMYLHKYLEDEKGDSWPMVGAIQAKCSYQGKLVRFGYVEITEKGHCFLPEGTSIKGHEFHYYDSEQNGVECLARKPVSERQWECIHVDEGKWWGFPHLYYPSNPEFVKNFIDKCKEK